MNGILTTALCTLAPGKPQSTHKCAVSCTFKTSSHGHFDAQDHMLLLFPSLLCLVSLIAQ